MCSIFKVSEMVMPNIDLHNIWSFKRLRPICFNISSPNSQIEHGDFR